MKRLHKIIAGTTGALALAVATAVTAAPFGNGAGCAGGGPGFGAGAGPGFGPGYGPGRMAMMHGGGPGYGMRGGFWAGSAEGLAQLKTELAITAEQEAAWKAFAAKAGEQAEQMQAQHAQHWQAMRDANSAPAQMSLRIGWMTQRLAAMQAVNTALSDLYTTLTPAQRATADEYFGHMGPMGRRFGQRG